MTQRFIFIVGAVKLTPSHSSVDHEIAQRHKLRHISVLNDEGRIVNAGPEFDVSRNILITEQN